MKSHIKRRQGASAWREYRNLLFFAVLLFGFRSAWADWVRVPTGSMNPTILEGDRLLVDKHVFGLRIPFSLMRLTEGKEPGRGDIVVFKSPSDGTLLVKRLIGLPGDVVALDGETLVVNGHRARYTEGDPDVLRELLASTAAQNPVALREAGFGNEHDILRLRRDMPRNFGPLTVPEGTYFMLGDNRDNSADSRYFGVVPRRNLVGRATRVVVSLDPDHYHRPRRGRFLMPLS